jgi:hypothetical protein
MVSSAVVAWKKLENVSRAVVVTSPSRGEAPFLESPLNGSEEAKRKERGFTELIEKRQGTAYRYT